MKLPVYLYGHPVLRAISTDVTPEYPELKKFVADMWETMYNSDGVGLAAPQVGRNDRIVVIDADPVADAFPECKGRKFTLINPEIEILDGPVETLSEYPEKSQYICIVYPNTPINACTPVYNEGSSKTRSLYWAI